jgi:thiamine biosynthesis lipoprotein ApbE
VWIAGLPEAQARPAAAAVLREFDRLHRTYHAWKPSELSALNAALAAGRQQPVTPQMAELIVDAQRLARLSEGLFDPGIGRLVESLGVSVRRAAGRQLARRRRPGRLAGGAPGIIRPALARGTRRSRSANWRSISAAI